MACLDVILPVPNVHYHVMLGANLKKTILLLYRYGFYHTRRGERWGVSQNECGYFCNSDFSVLTQWLGIMLMWVLLGTLRTLTRRLSGLYTMKRNESTCATCVFKSNKLRKKYTYFHYFNNAITGWIASVFYIADIEFDIWTDSIIDGIMDAAAADGDSQDTSWNIRTKLMFTIIIKTKLQNALNRN